MRVVMLGSGKVAKTVFVALLLATGVAAAQANETAISNSPAVIQNLVGLGVWALIGIGILVAIVGALTHLIGQYFSYKVLEKGVSTIVNLKTLQEVDRALDNNNNRQT